MLLSFEVGPAVKVLHVTRRLFSPKLVIMICQLLCGNSNTEITNFSSQMLQKTQVQAFSLGELQYQTEDAHMLMFWLCLLFLRV